jgi:hypothetical protein
MAEFLFEDCLLKHYIRRDVWLPFCRELLRRIRAHAKPKNNPRRLRYFTFCAVGALDVLLLDRERVVRRSSTDEFDTVCFFDKDATAVTETQKRIPGANGFPGNFTEIVLQAEDGDTDLDMKILTDDADTREVREKQRTRAQLGIFIQSFPFDVMNLDVEQYLFHPKEKLPGTLTNTLRKLLEWQRRQGHGSNGRPFILEEFALMFTTQVGPPILPDDYLNYLQKDCLQRNIDTYGELNEPFLKKSGGQNVAEFFKQDFDGAFKLAVPKSLSELAFEQDWFIDDSKGIQVFQFDRPFSGGAYRMLHMAMIVRRQSPPKENRAPGQNSPPAAADAHKKTIQKLFNENVIPVEELVKGELANELQVDLDKLFKHRERYYVPPVE